MNVINIFKLNDLLNIYYFLEKCIFKEISVYFLSIKLIYKFFGLYRWLNF